MSAFQISVSRPQRSCLIDLLSHEITRPSWTRMFVRSQNHWNPFSGSFCRDSSNKMIYRANPNVKTGENICVTGPSNWNEFTYQVRFRLLTDSLIPPQGGVILYYLYKSMRNYYSLHFCVVKKSIEAIKRIQGKWITTFEHEYHITPNKDYCVQIRVTPGKHDCLIDGESLFSIEDLDILKGCVGVGVKYCDAIFNHISVFLPEP